MPISEKRKSHLAWGYKTTAISSDSSDTSQPEWNRMGAAFNMAAHSTTMPKPECDNSEMLREMVAQHGFAIIPTVLSSAEITSVLQHLSEGRWRRRRAGARHLMADKSI